MPRITTLGAMHLSFLVNVFNQMRFSRVQFKIFGPIVRTISIEMMNYLRRFKRSAKFHSHYQPMLKNFFSSRVLHRNCKFGFIIRETRESSYPVTKYVFKPTALPVGVKNTLSFACILGMKLISTRRTTAFLMPYLRRINLKFGSTDTTIDFDLFNSSQDSIPILPSSDVLFKECLSFGKRSVPEE